MRRVFRIPFGRAHIGREVDDELAFHLEMRAQRLIAAGWTSDAARQEALRQFGDVSTVRADCVVMDEQRERAMQRANVMGELQQDISYALRTLRRNVGFTTVIVGALAIGIGANTAIFALVDALVVSSLPVPHPEQLVAIGDPTRVGALSIGSPRTDVLSYPLYRDLRDRNSVFSGVLASGRSDRIDAHIEGTSGEYEHPRGRYVSGNYFSVLGVRALAGRTFDATADEPRGSAVVTISHRYWTQRFHNDPSTIGRVILLNGVKVTIVGVTPSSFTGDIVGSAADLWLPISMHDVLRPHQTFLNDRSTNWLLALGRLRPGATLAQAQQQLPVLLKQSIVANSAPAIAQTFLQGHPRYLVSDGAKGFSRVRKTFEAPLFTLMIGVALLLCIICANVANLLLARAIARGREMAVRLALGADRSRLVRQLLTESAMLALISASVGLLVAWWGSRALLTIASEGSPVSLRLGLDAAVLAFTLVVSVLAVALFGVVPALRASRVDLASAMRGGASSIAGSIGTRGGRMPLGKVLIAGQVALSVVLLIGAAMFVRSLRNVQSVDVGLDRDHLVIVDLDINSRGYQRERLAALVHALRDRLSALPDVAAVTYSENGVFSGTDSQTGLQVPGFTARSVADTAVSYDLVGPGYVRGLGGRIIAGRDIEPSDEGKPPRVGIVNQALATFYFPHENAVGKYLYFSDSIAVQIVGVLADTRDHHLNGDPPRRIYFPYVHTDTMPAQLDQPGSLRFEVRTGGDPSALVQPIRRAVLSVDSSLPIDDIEPLITLMHQDIREERLVARLATTFGLLALVLAGIGLYGVMTYAITRRTGEIGLRVALGARQPDVVRMVLFDALRLVIVGLVIGVPLALASTRLLTAQLHGVGAVDPVSIGVAVSVLIASASVAALLPAVRASRVSPIVALRAE
jgi:predicted permease